MGVQIDGQSRRYLRKDNRGNGLSTFPADLELHQPTVVGNRIRLVVKRGAIVECTVGAIDQAVAACLEIQALEYLHRRVSGHHSRVQRGYRLDQGRKGVRVSNGRQVSPAGLLQVGSDDGLARERLDGTVVGRESRQCLWQREIVAIATAIAIATTNGFCLLPIDPLKRLFVMELFVLVASLSLEIIRDGGWENWRFPETRGTIRLLVRCPRFL
mmetsp:Transcript_6655/g.19154  ORF Transcript_6655/g.19154 Transcript_6655/m.19154 type:complete len:214 (+) Transcript_6655:1733-2374(+)